MSDGLALSRECRNYGAASLIDPHCTASIVEGLAEIFDDRIMQLRSRQGRNLVSDLFSVEDEFRPQGPVFSDALP